MAKNYDFSKLRILVVEDNNFMRLMVQRILESFEITDINIARDAYDGFEAAKSFLPDLIISDWDMEPGDGLTLLDWIRNRPDSPDKYMPIIMLTGYSESKRVLQARDFGVNEFLAKPVTAQALYSRLASVVENPRSYVRAGDFFGPDRRRRETDEFDGDNRRSDADIYDVDPAKG